MGLQPRVSYPIHMTQGRAFSNDISSGTLRVYSVPGPALVSSDIFNEFSEQTYETVTVRIPILQMGKEFKQPTYIIGGGRLECGLGPRDPGHHSCILSAI